MERRRQYESLEAAPASAAAADDDNLDASDCATCCCGWINAQVNRSSQGEQRRLSNSVGVDSTADVSQSRMASKRDSQPTNDLVSTAINSLAGLFPDDPDAADQSSKLGRLRYSIWYDFAKVTLTLKIIEAQGLAAMDVGGTSDPYVKVLLLPSKHHKLTTHVKHKTLNPRWNEVFAFEDYPFDKVINSTLILQVVDHDRFSKDDIIGEVIIPMTSFDLTNGETRWSCLQPSQGRTGKLGELCLSLCYDSTSGRLTVTANRARNLKAKDVNGLSDPYVKVWLIQNGRRIEKKKTTVRDKTLNPIFEETMTFNVSLDQVRSSILEIIVVDYDRVGRNEPIGHIVLGSKSGQTEVKHWKEMFAKAKTPVMQWHVLRSIK